MRQFDGLADVLRDWLPQQRWYAGKGRPVHDLQVIETTTVLEQPEVTAAHLLVAVDHGEEVERYQLLLGVRDEPGPRLEHAVAGNLPGGGWVYDAVHDQEVTAVLAEHLRNEGDVGSLRFRRVAGAPEEDLGPSIVVGAEQSNTSLVFGDTSILKVFRKVSPGVNPDLEVTAALAAAGSTAVVPPRAWLETDLDGEPTTLAMLQPFLRSATEGWALAVTSVRDLYAEADLHADEVGGDFAGEAERLGATTAEVHELMGRTLGAREAKPDEVAAIAKHMGERLDAAVGVVAELEPYQHQLRTAFEELAGYPGPVRLQRIHGDYHLGQVLRTDTGWVLLDFEGEPARPLAERRAPSSPLRDVAGMLRSFDYAAQHLLADRPHEPSLEYRAVEWASRNREAFCDGYAQGGGRDPREEQVVLRAYELDKAVYEVVYEARHRPSWLPIPMRSIQLLVGEQ